MDFSSFSTPNTDWGMIVCKSRNTVQFDISNTTQKYSVIHNLKGKTYGEWQLLEPLPPFYRLQLNDIPTAQMSLIHTALAILILHP